MKQVKNKAYFSRYQTKYRRRREGKTDYYARKRLVMQAKNKYNTPKYRLVVRFTNKDIICQIVYARVQGDFVFTSAYSHELPNYGIKHGLTNWSAAYATGLLVARRALTKLGLADKYEGVVDPDGTVSVTEPIDGCPRPFKVFLDVGLKRTSTGSRVFAALKGASDGGINIPHSESRFPGYDIETKELDPEVLRKYIFGGHVSEYMSMLLEDDEERYKKQFSGLISDGIDCDQLEELYAEAHRKIRENPMLAHKENKRDYKAEYSIYKKPKISSEEKRQKVQEKLHKKMETES
ncbi:unnamed protein product [Pneumocystis jirovecii]|uniref:Large ribosomal subunit protein uL18 C-terminal eukaryotes domain-containing protein n=2 Tax=Pneumocystis jirovecii TaxID=42068 RepID=L0PA42_PNEJI|nr:uncharacterized protein T551_03586 [Pneumocystis jirovecii RU7]KTW26287.1 hypothetical protein T551_03586 [Pneumocystis jirovecii RU7]CCJ28485.1 unnamed protein product [Pneumocystis jirovecii]